MAPILYMMEESPPCRTVLLTAKAIGVELDNKLLDLMKDEQMSPEFLKLNPKHTIPTLVDGDVVITDSHAISSYLVSKYAKDDSLYPKDLVKRAMVDQRMYFEAGTLFNLLVKIVRPIREGKKDVPESVVNEVRNAYDLIEKFLEGSAFIAGDTVTIADFSIVAIVTSLHLFANINESKYKNILGWLSKMSQLPCYSANDKGVKKFYELFKNLMSN